MNSLKLFALSIAIFAFLDSIWLGYVMATHYKVWIGSLLNLKPDGSININYLAALGVYMLLAAAIVFFVLPRAAGASQLNIFLVGGMMGLIIYGVYDFTNAATLVRWPNTLIVADIAWGAFATGMTAYVAANIGKMFGWLS